MIIDDLAKRSSRPTVLLDVDGTLVDSNDAHAESWRLASAEFGHARPASFFRSMIGMGGDHVVPKIDPSLSKDTPPGSEIAKRQGEIFKERFLPGIRPTRGARALVERLKRDGWSCVVATSAKPEELQALLEIVGIAEAIDERSDVEDASVSKPAPDIVTAALRRAKVAPGDAFLLGDSPYDVASAAAAGVPTVVVRCGGFSETELAGAVEFYDDPQDLLDRIGADARA